MTKKELADWLTEQKHKATNTCRNEIGQRRSAIMEAELKPIGFYEMAGEVESLIRHVWDVWAKWKAANENEALSATTYNYRGFESRIRQLVDLNTSMAEHMSRYDIDLKNASLDALEEEEQKTVSKIAQTYSSVIHAVYNAKNVKEAKAYLEGLGFDLSELDSPPIAADNTAKIDTTYLFLNKAA